MLFGPSVDVRSCLVYIKFCDVGLLNAKTLFNEDKFRY